MKSRQTNSQRKRNIIKRQEQEWRFSLILTNPPWATTKNPPPTSPLPLLPTKKVSLHLGMTTASNNASTPSTQLNGKNNPHSSGFHASAP
mmetsp:Transcript_891/g.1648  ORF Transcript_891/g.1648 Transcript_891/m.1648 type:complete len:90 (+) Transcript_891:141-410(+)